MNDPERAMTVEVPDKLKVVRKLFKAAARGLSLRAISKKARDEYKTSLSVGVISKSYRRDGIKRSTYEVLASVLEVKPWYGILVPEQQAIFRRLETVPERQTSATLYLAHRNSKARDEWYERALASEGEVLYVSIMSDHSFEQFDRYLKPRTTVNVLTWMPSTALEIEGFAKHLRESGNKVEQVRGALRKWDARKDPKNEHYHENITVRTYESSPTMQGVIVKDDWALIELILYDSRTVMRPALLLNNREESDREAFRLFSDRFRALWDSATPRKQGERPEW